MRAGMAHMDEKIMSQTARLETVAPAGQGRQLSRVLAGLWMVAAGVIYLILLRTRGLAVRNACGVTAGGPCRGGVGGGFCVNFFWSPTVHLAAAPCVHCVRG